MPCFSKGRSEPRHTRASGSDLWAMLIAFHTFVLPPCMQHKFSSTDWCTSPTLCGVVATCMSSTCAKRNSPSYKSSCTASNALCCPKEKRRGINGSPCSPSFSLGDHVGDTDESSHKYDERASLILMKGNAWLPPATFIKPSNMATREMIVNADTINGDDCGVWVQFARSLQCMCNAFAPCTT